MRSILWESEAPVCQRRLNTLATQSLFVGAMRGLHQIDAELVRDVADDQE
jgi:hypothetical protein